MGNEAAALAGLAEGVHQMRVGLRRLRAVLSAFSKALPAEQRRRITGELRWLADALAAARNLEVFESTLLAPARRALGDDDGLAALSAAAARRRKSAYAKAAKAIRSARYAAALSDVRRWFETAGWRDAAEAHPLDTAIGDIAPNILSRRREVAKRRGKGFARQGPAERHQLRIALKKLRYAVEILGSLYPPEAVGLFTKQLKRLQDDLGAANDVRVGREIVAQLARRKTDGPQIGAAGRAVLAWHERRLTRNEPKLRRHLDALFAAEPFWPR